VFFHRFSPLFTAVLTAVFDLTAFLFSDSVQGPTFVTKFGGFVTFFFFFA
jgi:hypothetical protein